MFKSSELFIRFLKENNAYNNFKYESFKRNGEDLSITIRKKLAKHSYVSTAIFFPFDRSRNGYDFWFKIKGLENDFLIKNS